MSPLTRREFLERLSLVMPVTLLSCKNRDVFDRERVCIHIFQPGFKIPEPLLTQYRDVPLRNRTRNLFQTGLPELILCTTSVDFLSLFQYFWPVNRDEFRRIHGLISIKYKKPELAGKQDLLDFSTYLADHREGINQEGTNTAVIFTFNDYTKYYASDLINLWRDYGLKEFVLFKDPTRSPYLCDYPSLQKGFKGPPS